MTTATKTPLITGLKLLGLAVGILYGLNEKRGLLTTAAYGVLGAVAGTGTGYIINSLTTKK